MKKQFLSLMTAAITVLTAGILTPIAASASGAEVTTGAFKTYASGLSRSYEITGNAHMVRVPSGKTIVDIQVFGLAPNTAYGVHVHNKACSDSNGGGHYMHDPAGPIDSVNEIWPGFTTNASGVGNGFATNNFIARPEAQSIVVHDTDKARIACADLQ